MLKQMVDELASGATVVVTNLYVQTDTARREIKVTLKRNGQEPPWEGDDVVVTCRIDLPNGKTTDLVDDLCFGSRVGMLGEYLYSDWGDQDLVKSVRYRNIKKTASTWREAASTLIEQVERGFEKLTHEIEDRAKALEEAEG